MLHIKGPERKRYDSTSTSPVFAASVQSFPTVFISFLKVLFPSASKIAILCRPAEDKC